MASTLAANRLSAGRTPRPEEFLNTIPDPRTPSPTPRLRSPISNGDLAGEVSVLSTKLINAINHSTSLDDSLQQLRHELDVAKRRIEELEQENKTHAQQVTDGVLLKKAEVDVNIASLRADLEQGRKEREAADKSKKQMEVEVENLTASLFEQANNMVADARRENEAVEKRNTQLRAQLQDTETLLASQQEQLQDLKAVMERISSERDETESAPRYPTAPSTPGFDTNKMSGIMDALSASPVASHDVHPDHPLRYSHLIVPVMRNDLQSYSDFAELLKTSRAANQISHNRSSSGVSRSPGLVANSAASSSSPNLPGSFNTPVQGSSASPGAAASPLPPLKDSKFFKRCLTEDVEPTLRLDLAPGLSWLARRTVLTSTIAGALVIEPFAAAKSKLYGPVYACALCGEDRRQDMYARQHRFRTSEEPSAQRYPLCEYCVNRVRATCDFAAFLRMCRDGTWKAGSEEEIRGAWEEGVRLRERMFWARLGGGVVPAVTKDAQKEAERRKSDEERGVEVTEVQASGERVVLLQAPNERMPAVRLSTPPNKRAETPADEPAAEGTEQ